jgi:hypothetical protein
MGVPYDDSDLRRLQRERLVALIPVAENRLRGKPTQLGIEMVRRGFFVKRVMKEYETRCPLLAVGATERLNERVEQCEVEVSQQIEFATARIRTRREEIKKMKGDRKKAVAENALRKEITALRQRIIKATETLAKEGVREFANCRLSSQGRLGVHAVLLRKYTARFASEMRCWLGGSEAFQMEPLLPWRQDSITQQAIRTCEDVLAERKKTERGGPSNQEEIEEGLASQDESEPRIWSPVVQEWEALKSTRNYSLTTGSEYPRPICGASSPALTESSLKM